MAVKHLTYLDLSAEQRREGAIVARERLQATLSTPFLTPDQRAAILGEMAKVAAWEAGRIPVVHTVGVGESLSVEGTVD